jgi:ribosomal protein S28E/S33
MIRHLQTANDALVDKNTELVLGNTTLQGEVSQLKTQLIESKTLSQAQHQAEVTQLKTQLLESKTLSQAQAQDHGTLLGKYQNLQAAVRTTCQHAHGVMDQLQSL